MTLRFSLRLFILLLSFMSMQALASPLANTPEESAGASDIGAYDDFNGLPPQEEETSVQPLDDKVDVRPLQPTEHDAHQKLNQLQQQLQMLSEQTRAVQESLKAIQSQLHPQSNAAPVLEQEPTPAPTKTPKAMPVRPLQKPALKSKEDAVLLPGEEPSEAPLPSASLPEGPAQEQYAYALSLLRNRDLVGAQQTFKAFVTMHPDDPLVINAKYWLGDVAFQQENYEVAAIAFGDAYQEILKQKKNRSFPQRSSKAPEILAKLACSLNYLGRSEDACVTLKQLEKEFPHLAANAKAMAFKGAPLPKCGPKKPRSKP